MAHSYDEGGCLKVRNLFIFCILITTGGSQAAVSAPFGMDRVSRCARAIARMPGVSWFLAGTSDADASLAGSLPKVFRQHIQQLETVTGEVERFVKAVRAGEAVPADAWAGLVRKSLRDRLKVSEQQLASVASHVPLSQDSFVSQSSLNLQNFSHWLDVTVSSEIRLLAVAIEHGCMPVYRDDHWAAVARCPEDLARALSLLRARRLSGVRSDGRIHWELVGVVGRAWSRDQIPAFETFLVERFGSDHVAKLGPKGGSDRLAAILDRGESGWEFAVLDRYNALLTKAEWVHAELAQILTAITAP